MPTQPPALDPERRRAALDKAQQARRVRAEQKELLKTGSVTLSELFERAQSDDFIAGMKIDSVLSSLPGVGKIRAKRALESHGIPENRRIRGLGERQKASLLQEFS
ncbi:MAG: hypothetical protein M3N51_02750 [Actinomycetota bacterium]|nr:hypothetical protein [Actinomycetota bacterium]